MSEPIATFARLLSPILVDDFFDTYYETKPVHIEGTPDKVENICSWAEFNELIQKTGIWSDQNFKMVVDSERVAANDFCERAPGRDGMSLYMPASHKVRKQMDRGASIVLDLIETLTPGIRAVTEALEMALATRISCNAYCSQDQRRAFPSHFDTMEVFALHIEGQKSWRVYQNRFDDPLEAPGYDQTSFPPAYHDKAKGDVLMEIEMKPGDMLYLPKGWYHDALASSEACLHLSFSTAQPTGLSFMSWVTRGLDDIALFRQPMPPHDEIAAHDAHVAGLKDALSDVLSQPDVASQFRDDQRAKAFGSLSNVAIPRASRRFRVRGRGVKIVRRGSEFQLSAPGGKGSLPDGGDRVVTWVLERDHFRLSDLAGAVPDLDEQRLLEITQALTAVGALEAL